MFISFVIEGCFDYASFGKIFTDKKNKMKKFIIVAIYLLMGINGMQSQSIPVLRRESELLL